MSDSPAARRILGDALQARAQTPDEAYTDLVRLMREPVEGTGPRVAQAVPFDRRPLHPFYGGPAVGLGIVAVGLLARWMGWIG